MLANWTKFLELTLIMVEIHNIATFLVVTHLYIYTLSLFILSLINYTTKTNKYPESPIDIIY